MFDRPCGGFEDDFSCDDTVKLYGYNYEKPGKLARKTLAEVCEKYGNLIIETPDDGDDFMHPDE